MSYISAQASSTNKSTSFAIAFGIHAAAIGALVLIPSAVVKYVDNDDFVAIFQPNVEDPPPPSPKTEPVDTPPAIFTPKTPVNIERPLPPIDTQSLFPLDSSEPIAGSGTSIIDIPVLPAIPKDPVFIGAKLDIRYSDLFQPQYPTGEMRAEIEGLVKVRVLVDAEGRVKQIQQLQATNTAFWKATERQALRHWRFVPATEDGRKVESWFTLTVKFEIH